MVNRLQQYIRAANIWAVTGIVIVIAVVLANGMNFLFSRLTGARLTLSIIIFGSIDAIVIPAVIAPVVLTLFKRAANLRDINRLLEREIAERRLAEQAAERRAAHLAAISEMAVECAATPPNVNLPRLIAEKLHTLTGAFAVGLSTYEPEDNCLTTRYISVSGSMLATANVILGRSLIGLTSPVSPEALNTMLTERFILANSLTETTFGAIPLPVSRALQATFGIGNFVGLGLCYDDALWGAAVIALRAGQPPLERELALALANIAAIALRRQKTEEALRREKQFSDDILRGLPGIFFMYDDKSRLVRWNQRHELALGYSAQELAGMCAADFFEGQDKELILHQVHRVFAEGAADTEATVVTRTGRRIPYYLVALRTLLDDKPYLIGFGIDITDRKLAEADRQKLIAELEAKNAELERFTYTVSHDLKAPLITIRGFLGFLEKDAQDSNRERLKADIARIAEAANKMQRLLDELLELSRIGRMTNPLRAVSFKSIASEALELVSGRIRERGVQVKVAPSLPTVYGDRARLVQVVQNLLDNACKFMGEQAQPYIEIGERGTDEQGRPLMFVRDNGAGIDPAQHDQVFGLFNKLDPRAEGTGVGLALVKRIIEVHGGRIWIESEGNGHGSTFCFTLAAPPQYAEGEQ